ncbi:MAG: hypothetical protein Q9M28_11965 [Mariprofundaceae bacterium]|nr:hypothetical protein [Mariprofundaceae bacterium]
MLQLIAIGFCNMLPQANANPMMKDMSVSAAHCDKKADNTQAKKQQIPSCSHCDQPDELWQTIKTSLDTTALNVAILAWPSVTLHAVASVSLTSALATGPPRSSTLLYTTTQRIRL